MVLECLFRFLVSVSGFNYNCIKNCAFNLAWFLAAEKIQMIFRLLITLLLGFNLYCADLNTISQSYKKDGPFIAGENLTNLKPGIHFLEKADEQQTELVIAVHGWQTEGFEWVYPIININKETNRVSFFRWKTNGCPNKATKELFKICLLYTSDAAAE